jgi:GNAT superfamily N-acetyltransferase
LYDASGSIPHDVHIREFAAADLLRCVEIATEVWPDVPESMTLGEMTRLMKAYVEDSMIMSTRQEVACIADEVVGVIFGTIEDKVGPGDRIRMSVLRLYTWLKFVAHGETSILTRSSVLMKSIVTEMKLIKARPETDAEVTLLLVSHDHRGKGIGRLLIGRLLQEARSMSARTATVYTTDPGCNWHFYEMCGFRKVGGFDDNLVSFLQGVDTKGLVFAVDLESST